MEKLAESIAKANGVYAKIAAAYASLGEQDLFNTYTMLGEKFVKVGDSYKSQKENFNRDFAEFFKYFKNELSSLEESLVACKAAKELANSTEKKLEKKKEKLFEQQQIQKWELDPSIQIDLGYLLKNKSYTFQLMLPKETKESTRLATIYGFTLKKLIEENKRILKKNFEIVNQHFSKVKQTNAEQAQQVNIILFYIRCMEYGQKMVWLQESRFKHNNLSKKLFICQSYYLLIYKYI